MTGSSFRWSQVPTRHIASPEMLQQDSGSRRVMAAMVWLIPSADTAQVYVITLMTYLIAVGGFMHIVAGSMEAFMLTMNGDTTWTFVTINFVLPVLAGNIIGGTALFALLSYAQVMKEI